MENIWIALVDDWELRGNGVGDVFSLQHRPAIKLMDLYDSLEIKSTFNVEVMQQLAFERFANRFDVIDKQRICWLDTVNIMISRGFDVQLHIHPQWHNGVYNGKYWKLDKRWNIVDYTETEIDRFLADSLNYLRNHINTEFNIVSFRAGAWGVCCPSQILFDILERHGVIIDISIVDGVYYEGESIDLDYRSLEYPHFPYYPNYEDARKISDKKTAVIEIPTQSVAYKDIPRKKRFAIKLERISAAILRKLISPSPQYNNTQTSSLLPNYVVKDPFGFVSGKAKEGIIIDLSSNNDYRTFIAAIDVTISRAIKHQEKTGAMVVPLIYENHTKDINQQKLNDIRKLITHIKDKYKNKIEFVTIQKLADNINLVQPAINEKESRHD